MVALNNTSVVITSIITILNITGEQESDSSYNYYYFKIGKETNASRCYGMYGCFKLSPPWTSEHRPVSLFPEEIEKVEPMIFYYSRKNQFEGTRFDFDAYDQNVIRNSGMDTELPVYLISHGYMEGGRVPWIGEMARELLKRENCNVIIVDWAGGSSPPYTQAVANIRLVGAITAHLLAELAQYTGERKLDHVHCIGHSLGAHMSGYIGYTLQKDFGLTLGRITGLDPAEPHFAKAQPPVRLDRSAAKYVDIIHTDGTQFIRGGLGMTESIGHVDYYPNGGAEQPGCGKTVMEYTMENGGSFFKGIKKFLGCNHVRSHEIFVESINGKCPYMTIACKSYEDFETGKCFECDKNGQHCITFGFHGKQYYDKLVETKKVNPKRGMIQYLMTGDNKPFCKAHFKVSVIVSDTVVSKSHGGEVGRLYLTVHSTTDKSGPKSNKVPLNDGGYHEPGKIYTAVIPADSVPTLKAIEVELNYPSNVLNPLTWRLLASPRLYVAKLKVESMETRERLTVCPKNNKPLISSIPQLMLPSYCT